MLAVYTRCSVKPGPTHLISDKFECSNQFAQFLIHFSVIWCWAKLLTLYSSIEKKRKLCHLVRDNDQSLLSQKIRHKWCHHLLSG